MTTNLVPYDIPFRIEGKPGKTLKGILCIEGLVRAAQTCAPEFQQAARRRATQSLLEDKKNRKKFPPKAAEILLRASKRTIKESSRQVSGFIDWDGVKKSASYIPGTCPKCEFQHPSWERGSSFKCPRCGEMISG